jgi:hypothetical protein
VEKDNKSWQVDGRTDGFNWVEWVWDTLLPRGTVLDGVFVSMGEICIAGFVMGV